MPGERKGIPKTRMPELYKFGGNRNLLNDYNQQRSKTSLRHEMRLKASDSNGSYYTHFDSSNSRL